MEITVLGFKFRLEILSLIVIVFFILSGHLLGSCCKTWSLTEGFTPANTNYGESSAYTLGDNINTSNWGTSNMVVTPGTTSWGQPSLIVTPGQKPSKGVEDILNRQPQPIPLPEGELDLLATTPFKPECCPNAFSNSDGCACMTVDQYNYLITRGGNNIPYSEY
jgi:hypothetical protein